MADPAGGSLPGEERIALRVADAVSAVGGRIPDPLWKEARAAWSEIALVEIVGMAATFALFNRLSNALEVDVTA